MVTIALFTYNRPQHLRKVIGALSNNLDYSNSRLIIYSDDASDDKDVKLVQEVRSICEGVKRPKELEVIKRIGNKGLANNIIEGLSELFIAYDAIVVLEDDLVTSPGFINYMSRALDYYRDRQVFSICGYSPAGIVPADFPYSTYLVPRIGSWGWATWRERWALADWEVKDFKQFIFSDIEIDSFNKAGNDLTPMLVKQQAGLNNSWAIRFAYAGFKHLMPTVYPSKSLITNIGNDGSGTHVPSSNKYRAAITEFVDGDRFCPHDFINEEISKKFKSFYDTSIFRSLINTNMICKTRRSLSHGS